MPGGLDKRAARLAVTRFKADPRRVREVYLAGLQAQRAGERVDLIELLVQADLLTGEQAGQLREALDRTQIDPNAPIRKKSSAPEATIEVAADSAARRTVVRTKPDESVCSIVEYRRLRKIGEGGMGEVWLAFDESAERLVAIKVLWSHLASNPALVERFKREAAHSIKLEHPNIVRGFTANQEAVTNRWYLVMEYVDGPSVQALLDKHGKLAIGDAVHITLDIAHALEYAHSRNIVHRDIKPENILLTRTGVAKLADLGLSKATDQVSHLTATRQGFGTPYYMPYEQAMNARSADGRSDIYALGATLYHMITGQVPFRGETQVDILEKKEAGVYPPASLINPEVPPELELILDKMMARDRRDRYQTASELIVDLERSGLAAAVLSFVDRDAALQDPVVRARVVLAHQTTQPDIQAPSGRVNGGTRQWSLRYRDKQGNLHDSTVTTDEVIERIRQGLVNGNAKACPQEGGEFQNLDHYPVFREAVRSQARPPQPRPEAKPLPPEPAPISTAPPWQLWLLAGGGLLLALLVAVFLLKFLS